MFFDIILYLKIIKSERFTGITFKSYTKKVALTHISLISVTRWGVGFL